jgi:hypothetical protein
VREKRREKKRANFWPHGIFMVQLWVLPSYDGTPSSSRQQWRDDNFGDSPGHLMPSPSSLQSDALDICRQV